MHPLAAVYWDRDSGDLGDLVTAETLGPGPETCLRFVTQPKTGYTLVFTDKLGRTLLLAAWHDEILRWMPASEFNLALAYA